MDFVSLAQELARLESPARVKRNLNKGRWGLPSNIDRNDIRSMPLLAFYELLAVVRGIADEMSSAEISLVQVESHALH